jgi:hypothetical protein
MTTARFTLERGHWYGLTMFPGYFDCPYHSPIRVDEIEALGGREFSLRFLNLAYATGVQNFTKRLRTLRRAKSHLLAEETEVDDRTYVVVAFNKSWLKEHFPHLEAQKFFDADGRPVDRALIGLAATAI